MGFRLDLLPAEQNHFGVATMSGSSFRRSVQVALRPLARRTAVVATVNGKPQGVWVESVHVAHRRGYFTIYLNRPSLSNVRVSWLASP
jgi:hypothetical protein